ncbi:MAG TPA: hypothetical protein ENI86_05295 [Acidimicrobiales bacterium]|nr:hypothetical protein [Acidimicrobiales bacterium]
MSAPIDLRSGTCSICGRDGSTSCEDCGRPVCEIHAHGHELAEYDIEGVPPHLCAVCTHVRADRAAGERRRMRNRRAQRLEDMGPTGGTPLMKALWWARLLEPVIVRDAQGVDVNLVSTDPRVSKADVVERVVLLLAHAGLAGRPDREVAPRLWLLLNESGVRPDGRAQIPRRLLAGYRYKAGFVLAPLQGRSQHPRRVSGAVLTPDHSYWGDFELREDLSVGDPVSGMGTRTERDLLRIGPLSALAHLIPADVIG